MPLINPHQKSHTQRNCLHLNPIDNIAVVVSPNGLIPGEEIFEFHLSSKAKVPRGHKVALIPIGKGEAIIKLGCVIGIATEQIEPGSHVHVHNVKLPPPEECERAIRSLPVIEGKFLDLAPTFLGYSRKNGSVGIRNYIVVVSTVNCSATVTKAVCRQFWGRDLSSCSIDGIIPVADPAGCTQEIGGEYHRLLNRTLSGWIFHPNVVGAVVIGLGCEGTTSSTLLRPSEARDIPIEHFNIQEIGGTTKSIREGVKRVEKIISLLPKFERSPQSISSLKLALNCGGSDAFSAITANPALGLASDLVVERGGTVVLAEIPECHGAERLLYDRSPSLDTKRRLRSFFDWWQRYSKCFNLTLDNNLAQGNIAGGITTIIEKSIGAVSKGGSTSLVQAVDYAEPITEHGFTIMNTPGYDPVSVTGLVAGGCQIVAFTTGRGSVYGCSIAPTIKIATHSELFQRLREDMDVNAGSVLEQGRLDLVGKEIYEFIIQVANGQKTASEALGLGWEEFLPWAIGETF